MPTLSFSMQSVMLAGISHSRQIHPHPTPEKYDMDDSIDLTPEVTHPLNSKEILDILCWLESMVQDVLPWSIVVLATDPERKHRNATMRSIIEVAEKVIAGDVLACVLESNLTQAELEDEEVLYKSFLYIVERLESRDPHARVREFTDVKQAENMANLKRLVAVAGKLAMPKSDDDC